jgi:cobalamin biosynthesis protein CobD/CbiB
LSRAWISSKFKPFIWGALIWIIYIIFCFAYLYIFQNVQYLQQYHLLCVLWMVY